MEVDLTETGSDVTMTVTLRRLGNPPRILTQSTPAGDCPT
jgi:hypothetical protein